MFNSLANRKRAPGGGRKPALRSIEEKRFSDVKEVIVDGTERPVQRPQNRERQNEVSH
ncbi:hypothetical protein [Cylindrospermopsis raciborskii]|uniref:hypothetical protein n=1 Tax=Cylindrospermopsis raciborskii TaxID=77022 RepID=UPI001F0D2792|nr:hypothetical protein [Cylindrospermopsis raciborskii]